MVALSPSPARPVPVHASTPLRLATLEAELAAERARRRAAEAEVARLRAIVEHTAAGPAASSGGPRLVAFPEVQSPENHRQLMRLGLSARQAEVLFWMANGKTTREIATIIGAAAGTVRKHCEQIYARLGVEGHRSAMLRAYEVLRAG